MWAQSMTGVQAGGSSDHNNSTHLFRTYCVPGTVLSAFPYVDSSTADDNPMSIYYCPRFTDEDTEAQRAK